MTEDSRLVKRITSTTNASTIRSIKWLSLTDFRHVIYGFNSHPPSSIIDMVVQGSVLKWT